MPKQDDTYLTDTVSQYGTSEPVIYRYHSSNRPPVAFYLLPRERSNWRERLYLGVELEFDMSTACTSAIPSRNRRVRLSTIQSCNNIFQSSDYAYFMLDGSLNNGLELITQPSTLSFYESKRKEFGDVFNAIKSNNFISDTSSRTGYHIHFNRDFYKTDKQLENLLFVMERYWPYLVYCSRRRVDDIIRWANYYLMSPEDIIETINCAGRTLGRYHALNLSNEDTVEFRLWHGTLDTHVFYATLRLVYNLIVMAKKCTREEIARIPFECLLTTPEMASFWLDVSKRKNIRKYDAFLATAERCKQTRKEQTGR